jgi:hypothetical protein
MGVIAKTYIQIYAKVTNVNLRRSRFFDGRESRFRRPRNALDDVVVLAKLHLALLRVHGPHPDSLE